MHLVALFYRTKAEAAPISGSEGGAFELVALVIYPIRSKHMTIVKIILAVVIVTLIGLAGFAHSVKVYSCANLRVKCEIIQCSGEEVTVYNACNVIKE